MTSFRLLYYADAAGAPRAGILVNHNTVLELREALPEKA